MIDPLTEEAIKYEDELSQEETDDILEETDDILDETVDMQEVPDKAPWKE